MKPYLSVIIPAYNEAKRLPPTLVDINKHLEKVDFEYEIIVVDNNSTDATSEVVERFSHIIKNLKLVKLEMKGKGLAVKEGMLKATGEYRAFTDADNSISFDQIINALKHFNNGVDVVIGSRDVKGAREEQPWYRQLAGNIGNLIIQALLLPGLWDTQCPLKIFKAEVAKKVFSVSRIKHWGFDVEILSLAKKMGYKIKEIPAVFISALGSGIKPITYVYVLLEVFKIKWWLITNKYNL